MEGKLGHPLPILNKVRRYVTDLEISKPTFCDVCSSKFLMLIILPCGHLCCPSCLENQIFIKEEELEDRKKSSRISSQNGNYSHIHQLEFVDHETENDEEDYYEICGRCDGSFSTSFNQPSSSFQQNNNFKKSYNETTHNSKFNEKWEDLQKVQFEMTVKEWTWSVIQQNQPPNIHPILNHHLQEEEEELIPSSKSKFLISHIQDQHDKLKSSSSSSQDQNQKPFKAIVFSHYFEFLDRVAVDLTSSKV